MATNPYFTSHSAAITNEQMLLEDLIVEVVKISGIDIYYVPRESEITISNILGEQPDTRLTDAYPIEVYLVNFDGYDGDNEFLTKFGLEIRSSTNLIMTARSFRRHITPATGFSYPREGDILYIPMLSRLFEIKHSDPDVNFHQLGRKAAQPYYWELRVEQFKYNQENIDTGISDIDLIGVLNSYTIQLHLSNSSSDNYLIGEEVYQGNNYITSTATATVSDWNPVNKILSISSVRGEFTGNTGIIGVRSGATYVLSDYDNLEDHVPDDTSDNLELGDEANLLLDVSENNPLANITTSDVTTDGLMDGESFLIPD